MTTDNSGAKEDCPIPPPKLLKADSLVETCARCGAWIQRYPAFLGESDGFWECDKCDGTYIKIRPGRPYGPKSREWTQIVESFNDAYFYIPYWDWDTVQTEPPMNTLDWAAVETWFRSQNIYRFFVQMGSISQFEAKGQS